MGRGGSVLPGNVTGMEPHDLAPVPPSASQPTTMRVRTPGDIAAFVPLAMGFVPQRSVVVVSVGAHGGGMHARVDLPHDPDDVDDVVEALLRPARRNGVRDVVVVVYDDETTVADEAAWSVHEEFTAAGIGVREVLRVHDDHWYAVLPGAPLAAYRGVPFTRAEHPFTAQAVFEGRVTHASREALRETVAPDAGAVARSLPHLVDATPLPPGGLTALVRRHVRAGTTFSASELASVVAGVRTGERRDEAWAWLGRADARHTVELWADAVRRLPATHVAGPAAVLAFAAWLAGDGALSWCAVDRCRESEPTHSLAGLVAQLLESATPPDTWATLQPEVGASGDPAA